MSRKCPQSAVSLKYEFITMTDKNDKSSQTDKTGKKSEQSKSSVRTGEGPASKRPYATLDLKATEVDVKPATSEDAKSKRDATADANSPRAEPAQSVDSAAGSNAAAPASSGKQQSADPIESAPHSPAAPTTKRHGGVIGVLSHLAAGVAGAVLTLLAADALAPQLGFGRAPPEAAQVTDLQSRLSALERSLSGAVAARAEIGQKLAATEAQLAQVEDLGRKVAALSEAQSKLANEAKLLQDSQSGSKETDARMARLEEALKQLAASANDDPQGAGRVAQFAVIAAKLADLENALTTRTTTLRDDIIKDVEQRLSRAAQASEVAKSGAERIDRELSTMKTDVARVSQRAERLEQGLRTVQGEEGGLKTAVESVKAELDARFNSVAKPPDIAAALTPVASKVAALEQNLQDVVKSEQDRNANAERIALSLELAALKRAMDRGQKYASELAQVKKVAGDKVNLAALERDQYEGVATVPELIREFRVVANQIFDADAELADGSVVDRLIAGARSFVRIRKVGHSAGDLTTEAIVGRMETALKDGRLNDVIEEAKKLPPKTVGVAETWLRKLEARNTVDRAMADIETALKSSLGAASSIGKESR
jgi:hypothetical protein